MWGDGSPLTVERSSRARPARPATSAVPTTGSSTGGCVATYKLVSQWGGGFQAEVAVQNARSTAASAWTATFSFANGQQVTQSWNATLSQSGAVVTARNVSYNGALAAGASTSFGFWRVGTTPRTRRRR